MQQLANNTHMLKSIFKQLNKPVCSGPPNRLHMSMTLFLANDPFVLVFNDLIMQRSSILNLESCKMLLSF